MDSDNQKQQIELAEKLQLKLLKRFDAMLDDGTLQATDAATLARLLMNNGWSIDPAKVPQGLRGVLTAAIDASKLDDDEDDLRAH